MLYGQWRYGSAAYSTADLEDGASLGPGTSSVAVSCVRVRLGDLTIAAAASVNVSRVTVTVTTPWAARVKVSQSLRSVASAEEKSLTVICLADCAASISMTINGPAPMLLAFFLNAAIDQQCELWLAQNNKVAETNQKIDAIFAAKGLPRPTYRDELPVGHDGLGTLLLGVTGDMVVPADVYAEISERTLATVRGTVQADILKEDQAQNTCIFSTEFALRMMGDVQQFFTESSVRNFYSVSISGYHIREAGSTAPQEIAFTFANGLEYVQRALNAGLALESFAPRLSFFSASTAARTRSSSKTGRPCSFRNATRSWTSSSFTKGP